MGFRFSHRVSILPGLKLNFSGSGVSLSAGVPGAHLNFGSRGTFASVGIPGSGISYRQRVGGGRAATTAPAWSPEQFKSVGDRQNDDMAAQLSQVGTQNVSLNPDDARRYVADPRFKLMDPETGRRLTPTRLEAMIKEKALAEKVESIKVELEHQAGDYDHLINFWHPLPEIASIEQWTQAKAKSPLESKLVVPDSPNLLKAEADLVSELTAKQEATGLNRYLPDFVALHAAQKEMETVWPERQAQLQAEYDQQLQQYQQNLAAEAAAWDEAETKRTTWVGKLLVGDLEEIRHTLAELLAGLQFPFRTRCDFFLQDEKTVCLHLDLPEIEDVIPETNKEILKSGETRDVCRLKTEQNADYSRLVMGECLFIAAEVFSYLPLAQVVQVAAYTQRPRELESDPIDSYLVDVPFRREAVVGFSQAEGNLVAFLARQGGRLKQDDDGCLGPIKPPSWLAHEDYRHLQ